MVLVHGVSYVWNTLPLGPHIGNFHFYFLMLISPHLKKSWPSEVGPSSFLCHVSLAHHSSNIYDDDSTWLLGQHKYLDNSPLHPLLSSPRFEVVISLNILIKNRKHIFDSRVVEECIEALTILSWMFWFWYLCPYGLAISISFFVLWYLLGHDPYPLLELTKKKANHEKLTIMIHFPSISYGCIYENTNK